MKRVLSVLLALCLLVGALPMFAVAANEEFVIENGCLTKYNGPGGDVVIPDGVTSIGESAFFRCTKLTSVTIPDSVISIGDAAFSSCSRLASITIPNSVTSIGNNALGGCSSLTSITIPNSVTSIDAYAFSECIGLTSITIPSSVTSIGILVFDGCQNLERIVVDETNPAYCNDTNGVLFTKDMKLLVQYPNGNTATQYAIPDGVTSFAWGAFKNCINLTNITISGSVTSIVGSAFFSCSNLAGITIPNSVTSIGSFAFEGCTGLISVSIPDSVVSIGNQAFEDCSSLTSITLPDGVTDIGSSTFDGCTSLTGITIPSSVTSIGDGTFRNCSGLVSITIPNRVSSIGYAAFYGCSGLTNITIPASVTSISNYAFSGAGLLADVYYAGTEALWGAIEIGSNNDSLTSATIHYGDQSVITPAPTSTPTPTPTTTPTSTPTATPTTTPTTSPTTRPTTSPSPDTNFTDLKAGAYYVQPVVWAVEKGITAGLTDTVFGPGNPCTRGHIVTFLWRAAGKPDPTSTVNPFKDVQEGSFYYKAVLWAVENNITQGTSATTFGPGNPCTRADAVTFMWRAAGRLDSATGSSFGDVKPGSYYEKAVNWAVENNITAGTSETAFSPGKTCTRGQIVSFLYRAKD